MKFAWTTHRPSTVLQGPLPVQARPFRLAWTRTLSSSALQGPSPVQANFINAIAPHRRPPPRRRGLPPVRPAAPPPASGAPPRAPAATHLHLHPRWSALQGLLPCKCVAATCPRRRSAHSCRYAFAPRPASQRAAGPPPLQMRSRHLPPASLSAALPLRICTPPGLPARCRPSRPANAYPPSRPAFPAAARQTQFGWKCVFGGDIRGLETRFGRKCVFCGAGGWGVVGSAEGRATWALFASR